jgi:hypothetical protein
MIDRYRSVSRQASAASRINRELLQLLILAVLACRSGLETAVILAAGLFSET